MNLYKLGTFWGKGAPNFYDMIKERSISISHIDDCNPLPAKGAVILITNGFLVRAITILEDDMQPVSSNPDLQEPFHKYHIAFDDYTAYAKSIWFELKENDQFEYKTRDGICRINKPEIHELTRMLLNKYKIMENYQDIINILKNKKQIILQGAPGTGKTYMAKDIAEKLILGEVSSDKKIQAERLKTSDQFKLVQFHPSYTYEDFVRGIEVKTQNGQPEYITCNKVLGEFASLALKNIEDSKKDTSKLTRERSFERKLDEFKEQVREAIAEKSEYPIGKTTARIIEVSDNSFKYNYEGNRVIIFNLLYSDLIKMHNSENDFVRVKDVDDFPLTMKGKGSYYFPLYKDVIKLNIDTSGLQEGVSEKDYVLIVDEINRANLPSVLGELIYALEYRGEKVESMYAVDGSNSLILPSNLYIIGTMNTADRSVGQIDYAIRRRFAFVEMLPKVLPDEPAFNIDLFKKISAFFIENVEEYINDPENTILKKSEWLSDEFLPEDVWIGHSYFIMKDDNRDIRLNYEIKPILREYLKDGILKECVDGQNIQKVINDL